MKKIITILLLLYILNIAFILYINNGLETTVSIITASLVYIIAGIFAVTIYNKIKKMQNIVFFILIFLTAAQGVIFFNYFNSVIESESRTMAEFPKVNPFHESFAEDMDAYVNDRIGLRQQMIKLYSNFKYIKAMDLQNTPAIKGIDGWFFLNNENDDYKYFQRVKKYTPERLKRVKELVDKNIEFCNKHNIKLLTIIPPNKTTVYPEYYTTYLQKTPGKDNYIILKEYFNNNYPKQFVMPDDEIKNNKDKLQYFKEDTHWTTNGAYTAYKVLEESITGLFPNYKKLTNNDIIECKDNTSSDLMAMLGVQDIQNQKYTGICPKKEKVMELMPRNPSIVIKKAYGGENAPKILLIHDSFMTAMYPFIENGASYISSIWTYEPDFTQMSAMILEFQPDLIIWERLERYWY